MRKALAVLSFELRRRWMFLAGCFLLGVVALAAPALPFYHRWSAADVQMAAAVAVALSLFLAATLGVGSAILAGELGAGREGFYLARPVGGFALWCGRMAAAVVIALLAPVLALLPVTLAAAGRLVEVVEGAGWILPALLLLPGLIALAGLVRLMARARSAWLVVLGTVAAVAYVLGLRWVLPLAIRLSLAPGARFGAGPLLAIPTAWSLALLAGSAAAAGRGRGDLRRASAAGGGVTAVLLLVFMTLFAGFFSWVLHTSPQDLERVVLTASSPGGAWTVCWGVTSRLGFRSGVTFVVNLEDGRWVRGPQEFWLRRGPAFSRDGRFVALAGLNPPTPSGPAGWVKVLTLPSRSAEAPRVITSITMDRSPLELSLSPKGGRLLTVFGNHFTVWEIPGGRPVARVREKVFRSRLGEVVDGGEVWLALPVAPAPDAPPAGIQVRRLAPGAHATTLVWQAEGLDPVPELLHPAGEGPQEVVALCVRDGEGARKLSVRRFRSGRELWSAPLTDPRAPKEVLPLDEGNVLVTVRQGRTGPAAVILLTPSGVAWTHELGVTDWVSVVPGPDTAHVILTADRDPAPGLTEAYSELLDLATGRTRSIGQGIMPAAIPWLQGFLPRAGSWGSRLLIRNRRELVLIDGDGKLEPVHFR